MTTEIEVVQRPTAFLVGLPVIGRFDELGTLVPAAWDALRDAVAGTGLSGPFAELSVELGQGRYHETLGVLVEDTGGDLPQVPGAVVGVVPAGRWVQVTHEGPREAIAATFGRLLEWLEESGHQAGEHKLDTGYRLDGAPETHVVAVQLG